MMCDSKKLREKLSIHSRGNEFYPKSINLATVVTSRDFSYGTC